mgnify:CR=1 FL=1
MNAVMGVDLQAMGMAARRAFRAMGLVDGRRRAAAVQALADALVAAEGEIVAANAADVQAAAAAGLSAALVDRLTLNAARLAGLVADVRALAELPDPVGEAYDHRTLPNGVRVHRRRVPLGVLGVIYESRPNVTIDIAALVVKTGNAAILRGGKETLNTNRVLVGVIQRALAAHYLNPAVVQFIDSADRALMAEMLRLNDYIDVIIPRGGAGLHQFCRENSTIPVITGGIGVCHLYFDASADLEKSLPVIFNGRVQRPSVCNSLDTLLVHEQVAATVLPRVVDYLSAAGVTFRAEPRALAVVGSLPGVLPAGPEDFDTEWMRLVLGLKVVDGLDEAIEHINTHSMGHSDGILTETPEHAAAFVAEVDSSAVFVNASTRFNDGGQLGLGAEVAVSTQRLHARGPMGLPELTTYKWVVEGDYTVRG